MQVHHPPPKKSCVTMDIMNSTVYKIQRQICEEASKAGFGMSTGVGGGVGDPNEFHKNFEGLKSTVVGVHSWLHKLLSAYLSEPKHYQRRHEH